MKRYLFFPFLIGLICANFTSTSMQGMELTGNKYTLNAPLQFISKHAYPVACIAGLSIIGLYATKKLVRYWNDEQRVYKLDEKMSLTIKKWAFGTVQEYIAIMNNSETNEELGHIIYQLVAPDAVYLRIMLINEKYREKGYGSRLLQAVLEKIPSLYNRTKVTLYAFPIDLKKDETMLQMKPKLIKFYQKNGAKIIQEGQLATLMEFDLAKKA